MMPAFATDWYAMDLLLAAAIGCGAIAYSLYRVAIAIEKKQS